VRSDFKKTLRITADPLQPSADDAAWLAGIAAKVLVPAGATVTPGRFAFLTGTLAVPA
jgi:hypothetical protein